MRDCTQDHRRDATPDKLSFVLFGYERELGVDPGRARSQAYRLPIHRNWYKATIGHNAVLVDRRSQEPAAGKLERFDRTRDYTAVAARCDEAYPGVAHRRLLVMTGVYLLVFDQLHAGAEHRFDWLYHNRSDHAVCDAARDRVNLADDWQGREYIQNAKQGTTAGPIRVRFADGDVPTYLTVAALEGTAVPVRAGVGASVADRVPMFRIRRQGRAVAFAAVLEPVRAGERAQVERIDLTVSGASRTIELNRGHATDIVKVRPDGGLSVTLGQ